MYEILIFVLLFVVIVVLSVVTSEKKSGDTWQQPKYFLNLNKMYIMAPSEFNNLHLKYKVIDNKAVTVDKFSRQYSFTPISNDYEYTVGNNKVEPNKSYGYTFKSSFGETISTKYFKVTRIS